MNSGIAKTPTSSKKAAKSPSASAERSSSSGKTLIQSRLNFKTDVKNSSPNNVKGKLVYTSDEDMTAVSPGTKVEKATTDEGKNSLAAPIVVKSLETQTTGKKKRRKPLNIEGDLEDNCDNVIEVIEIESSDSLEVVSSDMNPPKKVRISENETYTQDNDQSNEEKQIKDGDLKNNETTLPTTTGSSDSDEEKDITSTEEDLRLKLVDKEVTLNESESAPMDNKANSPTCKQKKLKQIRKKARGDKELDLQEKRRLGQQEKEAAEKAKKLAREQKSMMRRQEQEEREKKRLAELAERNEAKRKRYEAKEAEIQKKNMERMRKEQEKEEAELKKRRAAEVFSKFFITKSTNSEKEYRSQEDPMEKSLAFRPFQIKGDMTLAPISRVHFTKADQHRLDQYLLSNNDLETNSCTLYLDELRSGQIIPRKSLRSIAEPELESENDLLIVDEITGICQPIPEEHNTNKKSCFRAKFYKFYDNRRPPYYGTWRKHSQQITARRPFARDETFFKYDVDSDEEWEEEEPGEALDDSEGDRDESEEDDYEVDNEWFVPHGHLSEEELQNADDGCNDLNDNDTPEAQKTKLQLLQLEFAQEMKKKTERIKPRLVGCIWVSYEGTKPEECPTLIWDNLCNQSMLSCEAALSIEDIDNEVLENISSSQNNIDGGNVNFPKDNIISLSEDILENLIRLIHGNHHSKDFLVKEFVAHLKKTSKLNDSITESQRKKIESQIRDKIGELASWQVISINQEKHLSSRNLNKGPKKKKMCCWVVNVDVFKTSGIPEVTLKNEWEYILQPKPSLLLNENMDNIKLELCNSKNDALNTSSTTPCTKTTNGDEEMATSLDKANSCKGILPTVSPARNSLMSHFIQKTKLEKVDSNQKSSSIDQTAEPVETITKEDIIVLD